MYIRRVPCALSFSVKRQAGCSIVSHIEPPNPCMHLQAPESVWQTPLLAHGRSALQPVNSARAELSSANSSAAVIIEIATINST